MSIAKTFQSRQRATLCAENFRRQGFNAWVFEVSGVRQDPASSSWAPYWYYQVRLR